MTDPDQPERSSGSGRTIVIVVIVLLIVGIAAWALFVRPKPSGPVIVTAPTPLPSPLVTPSPAAPSAADLAAATKAAFPNGQALTDRDGARYQFDTSKLIAAPFGPVLVSEGKADGAAHVTAGRLDIFYLTAANPGFAVAKSFPKAVEIGSFGQMESWAMLDGLSDLPVIQAKGGFTGQGYTCGVTLLTELTADKPVEIASIPSTYDDSGAKTEGAQTYEGKITQIDKGKGFTVHFTGTETFDDRYVMKNGKYELQGQSKLPTC